MNIEESRYYEMVTSIYSVPLILDVSGTVHRSEFLYTDTKTGIPLLYLWDGESRLLTPGNEPVFGAACLHHTKPWVVFAKDNKGDENFALYLLDYSKGNLKQITGAICRITGLFWAGDDSWIVTGCDQQHYYVRALSPKGVTDVFTTHEQILTAAYDEKRNTVVAAVGRGPGTRLAVMKNGDITWISESDTSEDTSPCVYPEKGYFAYATDVSRSSKIVIRSIETFEEITRVSVPGDVGLFPGRGNIIWVDENTLFAVVAHNAQVPPRLLTISDGTWSPPLVAGTTVAATETKDGPVWIDTTFSESFSVKMWKNGRVNTIIPPSCKETFSVEDVWYPSFDGRTIQGWLLRNTDPGAPLVVYCHGGPNFAALSTWAGGVQELVRAGYHVFAPNFRGSTTFGVDFKNLNIGDLGGGDLKDVLHGARYCMKVLGLQGKRKPIITGGSYGGYLVLFALTTQPDEWAGGVALVPVTDHTEAYELADAHYRAWSEHFLGGNPQENPDLYRERSPITHLENLKSPVLIIAGENDSRCPLQPIKKFYEKAQQLNVPVELEILKGEGHGVITIPSMVKMIVLELEYLESLCKG